MVAGSNPTQAATQGPWSSPTLAVACIASVCLICHSINAVVWSASERLVL